MTTPAAPALGMIMTARAAPNWTEIPAEITSATGPSPDAEPEPEPLVGGGVVVVTGAVGVVGVEEEGAGIYPD
ncbi:hypothetical protein GCM10010425_59940 [Streptomyces spororaveus]|uniref:Uncharacterized protein n=1 Tax=Streptomyces spororaveus TaxID=284039 RepID=A0ABQ3TGC7_9ACTN|nr:hypothetical protein Sspor_50150 [Streptomyces spororaveus]